MNERQFIDRIQGQNLGIITISDAARFINKSRRYTALYLTRLENRGIIKRIEKGKYALPNTNSLIIASNIIMPSYISFLSGLAYYHKTTQMPRIIQVVTTKSKKRIKYENEKIQFIKLKKAFGYKREKTPDGYVFVGEIEKIMIDSLFIPKYCPISETMHAMDSKIDTKKLIDYAFKMNSIVVLKRLGYALELNGVNIYEKVKNHLNKRYDLLNPQLPPIGKNNDKWKIKINEVI
jgi:predicted transcriptional regulator of viral defense system